MGASDLPNKEAFRLATRRADQLRGLWTSKSGYKIKFRYCDLKHMCEMDFTIKGKGRIYARGQKGGKEGSYSKSDQIFVLMDKNQWEIQKIRFFLQRFHKVGLKGLT